MYKKTIFVLMAFVLSFLFFSQSKSFATNDLNYKREVIKGIIRSREDVYCLDEVENKDAQSCIKLKIEIISKDNDLKGKIIDIILDKRVDVLAEKWKLSPGVKLIINKFISGGEIDYQINDIDRTNSIVFFIILYILIILFVGRSQGMGSLIGLLISILVIIKMIIPMILNGTDPIISSLVGGLAILIPSIYFSHGFNKKSTIALLGTIVSIIFTIFLSLLAISITHLTGFGEDESLFFSGATSNLNMRAVLLASIIIGGMGLIDDVTVSQVAVIKEIYEANRSIDFQTLYKKAMNVGKDHIASMVNTLFIAYTASSLPLVMLLVEQGANFYEIINIESFSEEIVRTLVASIGLILAVPITTIIASFLYIKKR